MATGKDEPALPIPHEAHEPAFPQHLTHDADRGRTMQSCEMGYGGMTKREYFAAMALQGFLASSAQGDWLDYADWSVKQADALLRRLYP